jgi:G:T-mismatch repair DNA endonuclease (very short patch repair protein)
MRINQAKIKINKFETKVYELLDNIGVKYEKQFEIDGKFVVDTFIPDVNLIIQCDGDYWHGNPTVFPNPSKSQIARQLLDRKQDKYVLDVKGYKVFRIWELDFKHHKSKVENELRELLEVKFA